jgi:dolichol kinase
LWRSLVTPAIFVLSIGIAFFSPDLAIASWVLVVVADSMASRLWKRRNSVQG